MLPRVQLCSRSVSRLPPPPTPVQLLASLPTGEWDQPILEPHLFPDSCLQMFSLYLGYEAFFTH